MLNNNIFFSIVIPVFNVEMYLSKCVNSVLSQSFKSYEIILVDDGSQDKSPLICDDFACKHKNVLVIHKNNGGLSDARNVGISASRGKYVLLLDSDDWLKDDALASFYTFIGTKNIDIVVGNLVNENGTRYTPLQNVEIGKIYSGPDYYKLVKGNVPTCSVTPVYRRAFLKDKSLAFLVGRYHEDCQFTPRAYLAANGIMYTNVEHYVRFVREGSITTHSDKRKNLIDILFIAKDIVNFANTFSDDIIRKLLKNSICLSYLGVFVGANIYQYEKENKKKYIDKKLVWNNVLNLYRKALFCISPKLYVFLGRKKRGCI